MNLQQKITDKNKILNYNFILQITKPYRTKESNTMTDKSFISIVETNPELVKEWHPTRNGNLKPEEVSAGSNKKVWWYLPYDVPEDYPIAHLRGKHFNFEWISSVSHRTQGAGCPYLAGKAVWQGFNDLASVNPEIAAQWHPTKNGGLRPSDVTPQSNKKVWWYYNDIDQVTGKPFNYEWEAAIHNRTSKKCPPLSGQVVRKGFNDLETVNPELAKEWHPIKNGKLKPSDVTPQSNKKVWWYLPYTDPDTDETTIFEWSTTIANRTRGAGCPYLRESKSEQYVRRFLDKHNLDYNYNIKFEGLTGIGGKGLSYNFRIKNTNILIETNGPQHYMPIGFFGGKKQFEKQQEHDRRKREYARTHGYKLIEVSFEYNTYEKIEEFLNQELIPLLGNTN